MSDPDFLTPAQLSALLPCWSIKSIYDQHSSGAGPLVPILTKVGNRIGAWREDYERWRRAQLRLSDSTPAAPPSINRPPSKRPPRRSAAPQTA